MNRATSDTDPYDQYEFSIRLENVGTCMEKVGSIALPDSAYELCLCLLSPREAREAITIRGQGVKYKVASSSM